MKPLFALTFALTLAVSAPAFAEPIAVKLTPSVERSIVKPWAV